MKLSTERAAIPDKLLIQCILSLSLPSTVAPPPCAPAIPLLPEAYTAICGFIEPPTMGRLSASALGAISTVIPRLSPTPFAPLMASIAVVVHSFSLSLSLFLSLPQSLPFTLSFTFTLTFSLELSLSLADLHALSLMYFPFCSSLLFFVYLILLALLSRLVVAVEHDHVVRWRHPLPAHLDDGECQALCQQVRTAGTSQMRSAKLCGVSDEMLVCACV